MPVFLECATCPLIKFSLSSLPKRRACSSPLPAAYWPTLCVMAASRRCCSNPSISAPCTCNKPKLHRPSRSEEHTSELQSLMRISYAVFCLKKKTKQHQQSQNKQD